MILVTGAGGKTGKAVIQALVKRGAVVAGLVYRPEYIPALEALGVSQVYVGDMVDLPTVSAAVRGKASLYHIAPNMSPFETRMAETVIKAAKRENIGHLVYHSVLHPQIEAMPHHWQKMRVEERIFASGLKFTILQPTAYMQNILGVWSRILDQGEYPVPYPLATGISLVDLADLAEAAARVLTEPEHEGAIYELVGTPGLTPKEIAQALSQALGREVKAVEVELEAWASQARQSGLGDEQVGSLVKMFRYYASYGMEGNPGVLQWLLGRAPTSLEAFISRQINL